MKLWDPKKLGQDPKPSDGNVSIAKTLSIPPGKKVSLAEIAGPGSIAAVEIALEPLTEEALFQTWITMTWDGSKSPQVEAPLGAFFGGYRKAIRTSFASLLFGYSPAKMYCYLQSNLRQRDTGGPPSTNSMKASSNGCDTCLESTM